MVIAISQAVIGIGFCFASPLALIILNRFGLQGTFLILGGINAHLCVIAIICKPSSVEKRILNKTCISYNDSEQHYLDQISLNELENVIIHQEVIIEENDTFAVNQTDKEIKKPTPFAKVDNSHMINNNKWFTPHTDDDKYEAKTCAVLLDGPKRNTDNVIKGANNKLLISKKDDTCSTNICDSLYGRQERSATNVVICGNDSADIDKLNASEANENLLNQRQFKVRISVFKIAHDIFNLHLLTNVPFILFLLSTLTWNFTLSLCIMHLPNYMKVQGGSSDVAVSAIMTCFSASNLSGRFIGKLYIVLEHLFNPFKPNGISHRYQLEHSISV